MASRSFTCKQAISALTSRPQSITAFWLVTYSIYPPTEDRRLSQPLWLVTYRNSDVRGSGTQTRSPIPVLIGHWSRPTRCRDVKPPQRHTHNLTFYPMPHWISPGGSTTFNQSGRSLLSSICLV